MATIPRYQSMGVQYADLPRLSTAGMEQTAKLYDVLSEKLDRMSAYYQERAVTEAQKAGAKYAVQNPLTKEQLDTALGTPEGVKVAGAGRVFQETYEKFQANMLSSELQVEGQRKISSIAASIKAGATIDLNSIQSDLRDMVDGYAASVMALDPEQAVKLKASLTIAGNALYTEAAERAIKVRQAAYEAYLDESLTEMQPLLEALVAKSGAIDPASGKLIDIDQLIASQGQPFMEAIKITGHNKHYLTFTKMVKEAKIGALVSKLKDRKFSPDSTSALKNFREGNFGSMTGVFSKLSEKEKAEVRNRALDSYIDEQSAAEADAKLKAKERKEAGRVLGLQLLHKNTSDTKRRELVVGLYDLEQVTLQQAESMLKPPHEKGDIDLFLRLNGNIERGLLNNLGDLAEHKSRLSEDQYKSLGLSLTSTQGRKANAIIKMESGLQDNYFNSIDTKAKFKGMMELYTDLIDDYVKDDATGSTRLRTPVEAAKLATQNFNSGTTARYIKEAKERTEAQLETLLGKGALPQDIALEQIDFSKLGISRDKVDRANKIIEGYKRRLSNIGE